MPRRLKSEKRAAEVLAPIPAEILNQIARGGPMTAADVDALMWRFKETVYLALAVLTDGTRDILGIWIEQAEDAKFWLKVFTDLKTRGCQDILIAVTDGLKGMTEANFGTSTSEPRNPGTSTSELRNPGTSGSW